MNIRSFIKKKKSNSKKAELIVKINQDDIMRILVRSFQIGDFGESSGYGELLGTPGKDLRFIGIFRNDMDRFIESFDYDINKIDETHNFDDYLDLP